MNGNGMPLGVNVPYETPNRTITAEIDEIGSLAYNIGGKLDEIEEKLFGPIPIKPTPVVGREPFGIKEKVSEIKSMLEEANKRMADIRERL